MTDEVHDSSAISHQPSAISVKSNLGKADNSHDPGRITKDSISVRRISPMSFRRSGCPVWIGLAALAAMLGPGVAPARAQFGIAISGVGPINRSMGGASTAAPLDSG